MYVPIGITCGDVSISNGGVSYTDDKYFGSVASFSCNIGYQLSDNNTITCGNAGWSGNLPTCKRKNKLKILCKLCWLIVYNCKSMNFFLKLTFYDKNNSNLVKWIFIT